MKTRIRPLIACGLCLFAAVTASGCNFWDPHVPGGSTVGLPGLSFGSVPVQYEPPVDEGAGSEEFD